jgi:hypothetical protein
LVELPSPGNARTIQIQAGVAGLIIDEWSVEGEFGEEISARSLVRLRTVCLEQGVLEGGDGAMMEQ